MDRERDEIEREVRDARADVADDLAALANRVKDVTSHVTNEVREARETVEDMRPLLMVGAGFVVGYWLGH